MTLPARLPSPLAALLLLALAVGSAPVELLAQAEPTVVYLVRHSERDEDGTRDPPISEEGWQRSALLSVMLRDAGITHVHSTDLKRTRSTATPTAQAAGLELAFYAPNDLQGLADEIRDTPGRHLVVGHSNTTPAVVSALGGDPGDPIDELEYDRLYIVTLTDDGASTVLIRFGRRFAH